MNQALLDKARSAIEAIAYDRTQTPGAALTALENLRDDINILEEMLKEQAR